MLRIVRFALGVVLLGGCTIDAPFFFEDDGAAEPDDPPDERTPPPDWFGSMLSPSHGAVIDGDTSSVTLRFHGYHYQPGVEIAIQALSDPADLESWTTIAIAQTASGPDVADPLAFEWSTDLAPGAQASWPQGGVIRVRAVDPDGYRLVPFPHDAAECLQVNRDASWRELADVCGALVKSGAILVSPSPSRADAETRQRFLDRKGAVDPAETLEYYAAIDAPATVTDFKARFGFGGPNEVSTVYFNRGDLGIGREMRCTPVAPGGLACLVANYGLFGGDRADAIDETVAGAASGVHTGSFATVAMVYQPPITAPNSVQFMVYGPDGGALVDEAPLDTREDNVSIPNNCLNCHGASSTYDAATNQVTGARFLPFDVATFDYAAEPGLQLAAQQEAFRRLNLLVAGAGATAGIREIIDGFYGGSAAAVGASADPRFVPAGWGVDSAARATYRHAVAPHCRSCHLTRELNGARDPFDFVDAASFRQLGSLVGLRVCGTGGPVGRDMPNAEQTVIEMWAGPARAYLMDDLAIPGSCSPE